MPISSSIAPTPVHSHFGTGGTLNLTLDGNGTLGAGYKDTGTLRIADGIAVTSSSGYLGYHSSSTGTATVTGTGSKWTNSGWLFVGYYGNGVLNISNGGNVSNTRGNVGSYSGNTSSVTVDGPTSKWINSGELDIGYAGNGMLYISNGGSVSNTISHLGNYSSSTGTVTVNGSNSKWSNSGELDIGYAGNGTLNISNGGCVTNTSGYIGRSSGSTGAVTVDGSGSIWTNSSNLYIGSSGSGMLNIINGGSVNSTNLFIGFSDSGTLNISNGGSISVSGVSYVGYNDGSIGIINFGTNGGTITTQSLCASPSQLMGTGTINARGLVSDIDLVFGATHDLTQTITLNNLPGQNVSINLNMASGPSVNGALGAGYNSTGSLLIQNGVTVTSNYGYLGYHSTSTGTATVDGAGSKWTNSGVLHVGYDGNGVLNISNGGIVTNSSSYLGWHSESIGTVTVDGSGSKWINSGSLDVGVNGNGTLNISNGGSVSAGGDTNVGHYKGSTGTINFGKNGGTITTRSLAASPSQLTGAGTINASGLVGDIDLVFDATHGLKQTINLNSMPGQNIILNLDLASSPNSNGTLGAGYHGTGSLVIRNGIPISSGFGQIGCHYGSIGTVTVDGYGSSWESRSSLVIGDDGNGTLNIFNGGYVSNNSNCVIGYDFGSTGTMTIYGFGSTWHNNANLCLGLYGTGNVYQKGGTISIEGTFCLADSSSGIGIYNLNGGTLVLKSLSKGLGKAEFNFGGGTLRASGTFSTTLPMTLTGDGGNANVDTLGYTVTLSGLISGKGGLNKLGTGTLEFAKGIDATDTTVLDIQAGKAVFKTVNITETNLDIATATLATFEVFNGVHEVGEILGSGITQVDSGAQLTVSSIVQDYTFHRQRRESHDPPDCRWTAEQHNLRRSRTINSGSSG